MTNSIYLIDDDERFASSLESLLDAAGWSSTTFSSADDFRIAAPKLVSAPLLLDIRLPGTSGIEHLARNPEMARKFPAIILTGHGNIAVAVSALKAGAIDFLEKPFRPDCLFEALEGAKRYLRDLEDHVTNVSAYLDRLSHREKQVVAGLADGKPNKVIAFELGISVRTVEMHRANAMSKLEVKNTAALLSAVIRATR